MNEEWLRFQIEQANETFRFLVGLSVSAFSFLTAVAAALIVYGAQADSRIALVGATAAMAACLGIWLVVGRTLGAMAFIAARAERTAGLTDRGMVEMYARFISPKKAAVMFDLDLADAERTFRGYTGLDAVTGKRTALVLVGVVIAMVVLTVWMPF